MPATPQITLAGTLMDLNGGILANGSMVVQLCGYSQYIPRIHGTAILAQTSPRKVPCPAGTYSFLLWGNDVITPADTFYTVQIRDAEDNVIQTNAYLLTGVGTFDLSSLVPYIPVVPAPPVTPTVSSLLVLLPYSTAPEYDCDLIANGSPITFEMTLTGDVNAPTIVDTVPGQIVTFIFIQDGIGGHVISWPATVHNASDADPDAGSHTTQMFITKSNGHLYPVGPAIYS